MVDHNNDDHPPARCVVVRTGMITISPMQLKVGCHRGVTVTAITWKTWKPETGGQGTCTLNVERHGTFSSTLATVVVLVS